MQNCIQKVILPSYITICKHEKKKGWKEIYQIILTVVSFELYNSFYFSIHLDFLYHTAYSWHIITYWAHTQKMLQDGLIWAYF